MADATCQRCSAPIIEPVRPGRPRRYCKACGGAGRQNPDTRLHGPMPPCFECGGPLPEGSLPTRRYCTERCKGRFKARGRAYYSYGTAECLWCGKAFERRAPTQLFCSRLCTASPHHDGRSSAWPALSVVPYAQCIRCKSTFVASATRIACRDRACASRLRSGSIERGTSVTKTCRRCHRLFTFTSATRVPDFCSRSSCRRADPSRKVARKKSKHRRRARLKQVAYEAVDPREISTATDGGVRCAAAR